MEERKRAKAASAWQSRDFCLYQAARAVVILGAEAQSVAVAWQVYQITHSALALGYTGLALFLPGLIFVLPAGHAADRYERRNLILGCYTLQAICTAWLLYFSIHGVTSIWPVYAVLFLIGMGRCFSGPASAALLPSLVAEGDFVNAVTWGATLFQISNAAGPAIGGLLFTLQLQSHLVWMGAPIVYAFTLITLLWFILLMALIKPQRVVAKKGFGLDTMMAGLHYVWETKLLLGSISLDLFAVLLGGAVALMPIFAHDVLHAGPKGLGLLRAMPSLGALLVSILIMIWPIRRNAGKLMLTCVAIFGAATVVFGFSKNIYLSLTALFIIGASDMISVVVRTSLVQLGTPQEMRGRVSAVNWLFIGASNEFGEFESGVTAKWFGAVRAVIFGGIGSLIVTGTWSLLFPKLRNANELSADALMQTEKQLSTAEPMN